MSDVELRIPCKHENIRRHYEYQGRSKPSLICEGGREPSVEDGNIDAAVRAMDNEGWTCEAHEPGIGCEVCARIQPKAVRAIVKAWLGGV